MRMVIVATALALIGAPVMAQEQSAGRASDSAAGRMGERQLKEAPIANIAPMARVNGRISNRVQSRFRNRIDRYYDPRANASSPFSVAAEEAANRSR